MPPSLPHLFVDYENLQPPAEDFALLRGIECRLSLFHGTHQNRFPADVVAAWQPLGERVSFVQCAKSGKNALDFHIAFALGRALQHDAEARVAAHYIVVSKDSGFDTLLDHLRSMGALAGRAKTIADALVMTDAAPAKASKGSSSTKVTKASPASRAAGKSAAETSPPVPAKKAATKAAAAAPVAPQKSAAKVQPVAKILAGNEEAGAPPTAKSPGRKSASAKTTERLRTTPAADDADKVIAALHAHPRNRPTDRDALQRHIVSVLKNKVTTEVGDAVIRELEQRGAIRFSGKKVEYALPKALS